jgi:hypothetical protein
VTWPVVGEFAAVGRLAGFEAFEPEGELPPQPTRDEAMNREARKRRRDCIDKPLGKPYWILGQV